MNQLLYLGAAGAVCVILSACETVGSGHSDRFAEADANHDGSLSLDETNAYLVTDVFKSRDANHDGKLTLSEWGGHPVQEFRVRDTNHDGVVTLEEALAYGKKSGNAAKLMKAADKDRNGSLSRAEVAAYYAEREGPAR